jgi:ferric-dicitrate binding protein FerR (iron transport regulator)
LVLAEDAVNPLELISAYLDDDLSSAETAELEAWILAAPENADTFARVAILHSHVRDAVAGALSLRVSQLRSPELFNPIQGSLNDAMITDALTDSEPTEAPLVVLPIPQPVTAPEPPRYRRLGIGAAALILLAIGILLIYPTSTKVARLSAVADIGWSAGDAAPAVGEALARGKTLRLDRGLAELQYANGAKLLLQGPAEIRLDSDKEVTLRRGRLTAVIPVAAHGFTVTTPVGQIVDLGTEFGVDVESDTTVETQVFVGKVEAQSKVANGQPSLLVTAGQAAKLSDSGVTPAPPGPEDEFVRDLHHVFTRFPTYSTGMGLKTGEKDPHWMLTSMPDQSGATPKPTWVCRTQPVYAPDDERSKWLSTSPKLPLLSAGRYVFSTTFDLTGFDPTTAKLHLAFAADDEVVEVRLNGQVIPVDAVGTTNWYSVMHPIELDAGFVSAVNKLDVVVYNVSNEMGLKAELYGTAVRNPD